MIRENLVLEALWETLANRVHKDHRVLVVLPALRDVPAPEAFRDPREMQGKRVILVQKVLKDPRVIEVILVVPLVLRVLMVLEVH